MILRSAVLRIVAHRSRAGLVLIGAALAAVGCGKDPADPGPPTGGPGVVSGTVARQKTGEGVPNLIVALLDGETVVGAAPTDALGAFSFSGLPEGSYRARLTGLEFGDFELNTVAVTPLDHVVQTGSSTAIVFALVGLVPPRVLGSVECGGAPQADVAVRVIGGSTDTTVLTSPQGKFGATDLDAGHYAVYLSNPPCDVGERLRVIELLPGQSVDVDFVG